MADKFEKRIRKIEARSDDAAVQFTQTAEKLNSANVELLGIHEDIESEIHRLIDAQETIQLRIQKNNTIVQGLKNVLTNG